ncbi:transcription factor HHO1-like [Andrographis paniculata]|uniref:transcription factor HHO1-like n=1 Tax=Andrographis paniculata TaxID=175694 RepID=UPI0021E93315|nr:transcription factor HHO1-like [Andrographis paniculata]
MVDMMLSKSKILSEFMGLPENMNFDEDSMHILASLLTLGMMNSQCSNTASVHERINELEGYRMRMLQESTRIMTLSLELPLTMFLLNGAILAVEKEKEILLHKTTKQDVAGDNIQKKQTCSSCLADLIEVLKPTKKSITEKSTKLRENSSEALMLEEDSNEALNSDENSSEALKLNENLIEGFRGGQDSGEVWKLHEDRERKHKEKQDIEEEDAGGFWERNLFSLGSVKVNANPATREKKRRRWTSTLHSKFVRVTEELGGPKEAKPKQIRERMQTYGLTNDQVKSHLQVGIFLQINEDGDAGDHHR